jgi:diguanylate cyclase (GGDEF)-like protein
VFASTLSPIDFETFFNVSPNPYLVLKPNLTLVGANEAYLRLSGRRPEELIGRGLFEAFPGAPSSAAAQQLRASIDYVLAERAPHTLALLRYPIMRRTVDGTAWEERYWSTTHIPIPNERGEVAFILHHTLDVTALTAIGMQPSEIGSAKPLDERAIRGVRAVHEANTALKAEHRRMRHLFEQAPGFVCILQGLEHIFELANKAYYQLVGHRELLGKPVREALPELEGQGIFELLDQVYAAREPFIGRALPMQFQPYPGAPLVEKHVDFIYQPIVEADGSVSGIFVQGHDVSEAHQLAQEISHQAAHDPLTGLANRREFERRLTQAIEQARETGAEHSLLYLDLDQFKVVNDTCGHMAGDELLRLVSTRLREHVRADDILARLGGDEFALLLENCPPAPAQQIAHTLRESIAGVAFNWEGRRFGGSVSIGVVTFGGDGVSFNEVLSTADSACFLAKEKGRNRVHAHHSGDAELSARRREMDWISRLRDALEDQRLVLYAQRIVPLGADDRHLNRCEILVRLKERDGTLVPPMAFIPAAERYNLMPAVDRYVIRAAFHHFASLTDAERARTSYSINVSGATLSDEAFLPFVEAQIAEYNITPEQICFEITETVAVTHLIETAELIRAIRALGFKFALDDFGSGMSSFGYLKHLPVDFLKIDGVFIREILDNPVDCAIVEAIAKIASVMGVQTVAEFVDNDAVRERLGALGVDFAQGFGIHEPQPLQE